MSKKNEQKVRKYWLVKISLAVGLIGSSCLLLFVGKELFQTSKENSVPQNILEMKEEVEPLLSSLESSESLIEEKIDSIKKIESISNQYNLGFSRHCSWTLSHSLHLEQLLSSKNDLSQDELRELIKSIDVSLWRSLWFSSIQKSLSPDLSQDANRRLSHNLKIYLDVYLDSDLGFYLNHSLRRSIRFSFRRTLKRDLERTLKRDLERSLGTYLENHLGRDLENYLGRDLENYLGRDLEHSLKRDLEHSLKRDLEIYFSQLVQIKVWLFLMEVEKSTEINREEIKQISQLVTKELNKAFELELFQNYGLDFTEDQAILSTEQRKTKLIQFSILAFLSIAVLMLSLLFLIRQRNQGVTWSMTGMFVLPEECIGELETRYERLKSDEDNSDWEIRLIMLWEILVLLKSLYIQVAIEDLFLPRKNKRD